MIIQKTHNKVSNQFSKLLLILTISTLISFTTQQQTDITQKVDNNIPQPTVIQVQPQQFNISTQVTIPTIITPPAIIYPLYYSRYNFTMHENCTTQKNDPNKKIGDYIKFAKGQLGTFQGWNIQIIDGTYDKQAEIIYAILTNGSIIKAPLSKQITTQNNRITKFQLFNYKKNSTEQIWQLDNYQLYLTQRVLYVLKQKQLYSVNFIQQESDYLWQMLPVPNTKNIISVYQQHNGSLYIVKSKSIHQISNTVAFNLLTSTPEQDMKRDFVDMSIDNGLMYILCRVEGIYLVNMQSNYQIVQKYNYQFHQFANKINVKNHTVLINFKLYRKTYIAEFFFIPSEIDSYPPAFRLNKFYYRFDQMNKVIMFQDFGLVYSLSQINFFQHSINRKSPFVQLETQQLYRASFPKILDVIPLDQKNIHYVLVQKNGIFVQSFGSQGENTLFGTKITCIFEQAGIYELNVTYQGFCRSYKNPTEAYCTKLNTYKFQVNDQKVNREVQAFNSHLFYFLILILFFVLAIGAILGYRRYTIQKQQKLYAALQRRGQSNSELKNVG